MNDMNAMTAAPADIETVSFDFETLTARERYKLLIGAVVPRPIALITTIDPDGRVNAAPFSFFNCLSADPAILAIGVENHDDMSFKDTARNIRMNEEFTVHIVSDAILEAMNICAVPFPPDCSELARAGLTVAPGQSIRVPRIVESPAAFECRRYMTLEVGRSREIILGKVTAAIFHRGTVNDRHHVDPVALDAIGRMGGHGYVRSSEVFDLPTLSRQQFEAQGTGGERRPHRFDPS